MSYISLLILVSARTIYILVNHSQHNPSINQQCEAISRLAGRSTATSSKMAAVMQPGGSTVKYWLRYGEMLYPLMAHKIGLIVSPRQCKCNTIWRGVYIWFHGTPVVQSIEKTRKMPGRFTQNSTALLCDYQVHVFWVQSKKTLLSSLGPAAVDSTSQWPLDLSIRLLFHLQIAFLNTCQLHEDATLFSTLKERNCTHTQKLKEFWCVHWTQFALIGSGSNTDTGERSTVQTTG